MPEEKDKIYSIWTSMKARCSNSNDKDYSRYGGRGISVCKRWQASFEDFKKDMGTRKPGQTLERINNNGNYEPSNVRWASRKEQGQNRNHSESYSFDAEVFSVGIWNGDKYDHDDLQSMVDNFTTLADTVKPPIKLGHDNKKSGDGDPALGWVTALKKKGDKLIATLSEVPEIVYRAIQKRLYKRVSSEIMWNFKHAGKVFNRVFSGVALLGADVPAVKNLEDLEAFLSQTVIDKDSFDALKAYSFDTDSEGAIKQEPLKVKESKVTDELLKDYKARLEAQDKEIEANKKLFTQAKADADAAKKRAEELEKKQFETAKEQQITDLKTFCEDQVKAGKITPAQRDVIFGDNVVHVYSETEGVSITADKFKKFVELSGKKLDTSEAGAHGKDPDTGSPHDQLADKIEKYIEDKKVGYDVAYVQVLRLNPELAEAYTKGGDL